MENWTDLINAVSLFLISAGGFFALTVLLPRFANAAEEWMNKASLPQWIKHLKDIAKPFIQAEYEEVLKDTKKAKEDGTITKEEWLNLAQQSKERVVCKLLDGLNILNVPASWKPYLQGKLGEIVEGALADLRAEAKKKLLGNGPSVSIQPTTRSHQEDTQAIGPDSPAVE